MLLRIQNFMQENAGVVRLLSIVFTVVVCIHISACFWYMTYRLSDYSPNSWVVRSGFQDFPNERKYLAALYWSVFTVLTVGYGDIVAKTDLERGYSILWMLIGVAFYAFVIGIITSVIDRIDTKES